MNTVLKEIRIPRDAGYSVGLPKEATEPFPDFDLSQALARDLYLHGTTAIETTRQEFTQAHIGINHTTRFLNHAVHARTEAWLDKVTADQPFDEVLFFDVTNTIDDQGLQSLSFFSGTTLTPEELIVASAVFCLPSGEFLYDREAIREFIDHDAMGMMYWGPEIKSLPHAVSTMDLFLSLPSYTSTEDEQENCFSFELEIEDPSQAVVVEAQDDYCGDDEDENEDGDTDSEVSFGCVAVAAHDKALAQVKTRPRIKQYDVLPLRRISASIPLKYVNKKKGPPPVICIPSDLEHTLTIARALKSFQSTAPRKDITTTLRAMRANMRDAPIIFATYPKNFGDIQFLPAPRMLARPPRPTAHMLQPVHPEVKPQRETAKPLSLTYISQRLDPLLALHFPFERTPGSLRSLDLLRLPSATASPCFHSLEAELVPAPLRIDSRGIWPSPGPRTIQSVDPNIRAPWRAVQPKLGNGLKKRKARASLVTKPFRFLRKMLRAATREREWVF